MVAFYDHLAQMNYYDDDRRTACISTQAGCAMGCVFCATGQMGFARNLTATEIFEQVMRFARELEAEGDRLSNVVFMGMGEPFHNYEPVMEALQRIRDDLGIGQRHITISTVGLVPQIRRFADEQLQVTLAISLHKATDAERTALMPINKRWNIAELLDALRAYPKASNSERITFEYVMLKGVNDSDEDARRLVKLIAGIPAKINLIPFNEWPGAPYERSDWTRIERFADIVYKAGYASPIRTPRGEDIMAACGQLKSASERARNARRAAAG